MKKTLFSLLLLAGAIGFVQAQSAEDALRYVQRTPVLGARSMGLANTGKAGLADWSSIYNNPAGLGWLRKASFQGGAFSMEGQDTGTYNLQNAPSVTTKDTFDASGISNLGYIKPFEVARGSLVLGAGINKQNYFDRSVSFSGSNGQNSITDYFVPANGDYEVKAGTDGIIGTNDDVFSFALPISTIAFETYGIDFDKALFTAGQNPFFPAVSAGTVTQNGTIRESGNVSELNLAIAWEGSENLMLGLSLNPIFGSYKYDRSYEEADVNNANNGQNGTTDFKNLLLSEKLNTGISGINARLGASLKLSENLKAGISLESPTLYNVSEDYSTRLDTYFDNGDHYYYGGETNDDGTGYFDYTIVTPWLVGAGVQFSLSSLTLLGDVEFVDWSKTRLHENNSAGAQDYLNHVNDVYRDDYQRTTQYSVAGEYRTGNLTLRGGYATIPDARIETDNPRDRQIYSLGAGYRFNDRYTLNFGWMQEQYKDLYLPYTDLSTFNAVRYSNDPYVTRDVRRSLMNLELKVSL